VAGTAAAVVLDSGGRQASTIAARIADGSEDAPDDAASAASSLTAELPAAASASVTEELPGAASGPLGPDGQPLFARLPEFVAVYLVFASDVLVRIGELPKEVYEHYLAELRSVQPDMADAYENTTHCSVSFLTDTTSLKLVREWLGSETITQGALYNLIIGQTVLPSWRHLEALGPFRVDAPPAPEEFAHRFRELYPGRKGVVPSHLKQGVLSLLGKGPEIENCGRFIHELAAKIPAALARLRDGVDAVAVLQELGIPKFRALLVARLLSISDLALYDMERRDVGDFAELGLWLLLGHPAEQARARVGTSPFKADVDMFFLALVEALPAALAAVDQHRLVERLARLHLLPTCAQCVEHMLCEWRKMCLPEGRTARGDPFEDYKELWLAVAPVLARRAAACE
jgi:hypothetical protein